MEGKKGKFKEKGKLRSEIGGVKKNFICILKLKIPLTLQKEEQLERHKHLQNSFTTTKLIV